MNERLSYLLLITEKGKWLINNSTTLLTSFILSLLLRNLKLEIIYLLYFFYKYELCIMLNVFHQIQLKVYQC